MGAIFAAAHAALAEHKPLSVIFGRPLAPPTPIPEGHQFTAVCIWHEGHPFRCLIDGDKDDGFGVIGMMNGGAYWWATDIASTDFIDFLNSLPWSAA